MKTDFRKVAPLRISLAALVAATPLGATAQSFDCALAETASEIAICQDPGLSRLDEQLLVIYRAALSSGDRESLKADGIRFWAQRRDCQGDPDCLEHAYAEAIGHFSGGGQSAGAVLPGGDEDVGGDDTSAVRPRPDAMAGVPPDASTCARDTAHFRAYLAHLETRPMVEGATRPPATLVPEEELLNNRDLKAGRRTDIIGVPKDIKGFETHQAYCDAVDAMERVVGQTSYAVQAELEDSFKRRSSLSFAPQKYGESAEQGGARKGKRVRFEIHPTDARERERIDYRNIYSTSIVSPWRNFPEPLAPLWVAFVLSEDLDEPENTLCRVRYSRSPFALDGRASISLKLEGLPDDIVAPVQVTDLVGDVTVVETTLGGEPRAFLQREFKDTPKTPTREFYDAFEETFDEQGYQDAFIKDNDLIPAMRYLTPDRDASEVVNHPACQAEMKKERSRMVDIGNSEVAQRNNYLGLTP